MTIAHNLRLTLLALAILTGFAVQKGRNDDIALDCDHACIDAAVERS